MHQQPQTPSWPGPKTWDWGPSYRRLAALALAFALLLTIAGTAVPALALECGCTATGDYKAPAVKRAAKLEFSPGGGKYRLTTSSTPTEVTLRVGLASDNSLVKLVPMSLVRADWGFSPDGERFMYRSATDTHIDQINVWDLEHDRLVHHTTTTSGSSFGFSPHGRWFLINSLRSPGHADLVVKDSVSGDNALVTEIGYESIPGDPGDTFGVLGGGFSPDDDDRSYVYSYRQPGGVVMMVLRNLETRTNVHVQSMTSDSWWRFSPCGDTLGVVTQPFATSVEVRLQKTAVSGTLGDLKSFSPIPDLIDLDTTADYHRVLTTNGAGVVTAHNIAPNTADTNCPAAPALDQVSVSPAAVIGGQANSTGTVKLTLPAAASTTVSLSSSDTAAATVPASITLAAGAQTKTFTVTSKAVTTAKTITIVATSGSVTKTTALTVNPPAPTAKVSEVSVSPSRIPGGQNGTGTVTLDMAAGSSGTPVTLSSNLPAIAAVPASVIVPAGATSATFAVTTFPVDGDSPVVIKATGGGQEKTARIMVLVADRTCTAGTADEAAQSMGARAFAAFDDAGTGADCFQNPVLKNGITVGAGSTGLAEGTPVELVLKASLKGTVHTSPPVGDGGSLAEGDVRYQVFDDSVEAPEGRYQAADFRARIELQQHRLYPDNSPNSFREQSTQMFSNASTPQEIFEDTEYPSADAAAHSVDTGEMVAKFTTKVGAHLSLQARLTAGASAYGTGASGVANMLNAFKASTVPAAGFEGLDLTLDSQVPPNRAPVCTNRDLTTDEDTPLGATVACTDQDNDTMTYRVITGPANGTISAIGAGKDFTYSPAADFSGEDSFTVKANDGTVDSGLATIKVTVAPVNDAPTCNNGSGTTAYGVLLAGDLECTDPEGDALTFSVTTPPAHGSMSPIGADGSFSFTPASGYSGADSFAFEATDAGGAKAAGQFDITVGEPEFDPPANKKECRKGGWRDFVNPSFKNEKDCLKWVRQH